MASIRLPASPTAEVSVIVLAFRRVDVLDRCLRALARHETRHDFEVVVVANGASIPVRTFLDQEVEGGVLVRARVNLGFAGGCNHGVAASRGRYVVLVNDDAVVEPGWLDALVDAADRRPRAAVVGSLVLFPDRTVQDAGGRIDEEHMPAVVGRGSAESSAVATTPRKVDYVSGCAVLVRREAWDAVGGMDERFYPAYFEDVDLCLRLRHAGWESWFEPEAKVLHDESASSDLVLKSLAWDWNKARFLLRWGPGVGPEVDPTVVNGGTDLLEAEIRFLERAGEVYEERLVRMGSMLQDARFELGRLRVDHLGALEALEHERAHSVWLQDRLGGCEAHAAALVAEVDAIRSSTPVRQLERLRSNAPARAAYRALRRLLRR